MENCIEILKKTMVPWELSISEMLNVRKPSALSVL